jgi:hypothetical protein
MKAIVLEKRKNAAAVMKEDGTVIRLRCCPYQVGERFELDDLSRRSFLLHGWKLAAVCTAVVLAAALAGGNLYWNVLACSYVTLDVNPSIEYALNRRDKVIAASALNDDAKAVLSSLDLKGLSLFDAVAATVQALQEESYLDADSNQVLVSVTSTDADHAEQLSQQVCTSIAGQDSAAEVTVVGATAEDRKQAQSLGMSTGRFEMAKQEEGSSDEDAAKYRDMPVQEMLKEEEPAPSSAPDSEQAPAASEAPAENGEQQAPQSGPVQPSQPAGDETPRS